MRYIIDGYNLLFASEEKELTLDEWLDIWIDKLQIGEIVRIVFDQGYQGAPSHPQRKKVGKVEVIYAPRGETADEYIIEMLHGLKKPSRWTVVTSDREVLMNAQDSGAQTETTPKFLLHLKTTKKKERETKPSREHPLHFRRLQREFEKRAQDED